jgi:hypothetical protein
MKTQIVIQSHENDHDLIMFMEGLKYKIEKIFYSPLGYKRFLLRDTNGSFILEKVPYTTVGVYFEVTAGNRPKYDDLLYTLEEEMGLERDYSSEIAGPDAATFLNNEMVVNVLSKKDLKKDGAKHYDPEYLDYLSDLQINETDKELEVNENPDNIKISKEE